MAARRFKRDDEEEEKKAQAKEEPSSSKTVAADAKENTAPAAPVQPAQSREAYSGVRSGAKGKVVTQEAWDRTQNIAETRNALENTQYRVTEKNWDKDDALGAKRYNARLARHAAGLYTEQEKQDVMPNGMRVNFSTVKDNDQAVYVAAALYGSDKKAFLKDYAKRTGQKAEDLYKLAESKAGLSFSAMSRSGRLKEIGLMTLDGEDIDFDTAGPDTIVQAIRDIADEDLQKEAIKLWQAETRDKDSRFYGYNAYNLDYSFRDSALLTAKDYKAYANGLSGKFDPSESALEKSLRAYEAEYAKLEAKGKYVMRQELPVLQKAFAQQMGLQSAPDITQVRRALEEADKAKAAQKEAAKEPGLPEKVLGGLSEWWNGLGKGGEGSTNTAPVTAPAQEEEATTKAKPRVEGQAPFFGRTPQNSTGNAGQENTAAVAEAPTAAQPKVGFRGPLQGGTYSAQTGEAQSEDTEGTAKTQPKVEGQAPFFGGKGLQTEQPEIPVPPGYGDAKVEPGQQAVSGTVNMRDDPIGAITKYVIKGQGGLLDDETDAAVEEFVLSSPEMMALFGILSEEDAKAIDTGNHAFNVVIQNTGLLGPLARHAQKINSRGYLNDLKDDAAALLISLVDDAAHMKLTDEETADIEAGLTNRVTLFCEKHPDRLTELNAAMALSDEMNLAALGEKDTSAQEALDSARKRCRSGYATKADWELVYANAPVTTSAQKRGDGAYNQAVGGFQQLLDESYMTDSTDNWYNAQTLLYLHENGAYPDLSGKEAILYKNELQSYLWEAAGAEYDKAYALGYESLGDYWKSTGTGSMADLQQQALTLREADLKAMSEAPEEPEYKGDGSASTATAVIAGIATGMNELAAENYTALATMGAITDTDYDRQRVHAYYYGTGSFCDAEARCKADLYGMVEGGYFPDEAVAGYVKGYLDNGGVALDLGIMPTEYGWEVADRANEAKQRVQDTTAWAREYLTASQGRAFWMAANASNNTVRMAESFLLSAPLVYTGASGFGKFLAGTMNMMAAYGAPAYLEGVETALSGGADLKGANVMGTSVAFAQAQAEMFTDYGIVGDLLRATGTKELIGEGLEQAGMTAARRLWYAAKAGLKQTAEVVAEEVTKDEFFEGTFTGAAEAGTWKAIELTNGFTQMPSPSGLLKIAGASLEGGLESVGPVTRELIANIGENTIMTLPIALISGGIAGAGDWRSTRDVRRAAQTGKAEDVAQAGRSIVEDMGDPAKASAVDAAAQEAHLSRIASGILLRDEGETGTVAAQARAVREQADSHQKTYTKSFKANRAAQSAMAEAQAKLDAGDTSEETLQALKDAQEAFAKTRNNMDESWREYQQKKAESDSLHEKALTMARAEAQKQVQQERAELAGKVKAEQEAKSAAQESQNAIEMEAEAFVQENYPDASEEQKAELRRRYAERASQAQAQNQQTAEAGDSVGIDPQDKKNLQARDRFARSVSRVFSVNVAFADRNGQELKGARGGYSRSRNTIYLPADATQGDVVRAVLIHELTHRAEESRHYRAMADALLGWKYGDNVEQKNADLKAKRDLYRNQYQDSEERAALFERDGDAIAESELVASIAEEMLGADEEALTRLVREKPGVAQRIAETIKQVIDRFRGVKNAELDNMRRVENLLRKALDDVERQHRSEYRNAGTGDSGRAGSGVEDVQYALPEDDLIDQQIDAWRARALPSGEQIAERGQQSYGDGERQFAAKTAQQSQAMPDWLKQELLDNPQQHYYEKDSNDAQLMRAWGRIQQDGYEATRDSILKTKGALSADDVAAANVIMAMAFRNNDMDTAMQMAHRYNVDGTQTAKALQARKLFSRMTPTGMKARVAAQSEAKTAEYMRTHQPAMDDIKKRAKKVEKKLDGKLGGDELLRLNSSGGYVIDGRSSKWGVPINEQQQELIDHYKLGKVARPGLFYNRATTEQRMLEAILATPNPLELTGNGLNLIERLEMMKNGLAVVTNADLEYIGRNLASYASMDADMQQNRDGDLALSRAYEAFGNIDPATFGEKLRTWSYVSMLLSIPSAERNVIGNAAQNAMNAVSDGLAVELDKLVSLKTGERTRAHLNMRERADGWRAFVEETKNTWRDYFVDKSVVLKGEERFSLSQRGRVFQTPALEAARLVEGYLMSVGDRNFWKKKFVNSMAEQMRLAELNGTEFDYDAAVEIAEADANYATFTEDSKIRDAMADLKRRGGVIGWATHFIVPFTGVPTNIAKRQLQFSPLGILKTLVQAGYNAQQGGNFDQRAFVDGMSRGLTGTAMLGIGALLFKAGLIGLGTSKDEDDLYNLNTAQGEQYSAFMTVGKENISLSSFMPSAGPLVTGAMFAKLCGEDVGKLNALLSASLSSIDSVLDASYLSSVADFLKTWDEEGASGAARSAASSVVSQFTPAALNQLATALDPYVRDTKDADAIIAMVKAAQARIPGLREALPVKVDVTGEAVRSKEGLRNFFDPLTRTAVRGDETLDELERVWRATGGGVSIPGFLIKTSGSITIPEAVYRTMPGMDKGNSKLTLTSAQRVYYNQMYGQRVFEALRELMDSPGYQYGDDDEKAELLGELNSKEIKEIRQDVQRQICIDLGYDKY